MRKAIITSVLCILTAATMTSEALFASRPGEEKSFPEEQKAIEEWESLRYGMYIHFGISTFTGYRGFKDLGKAPATRYEPAALDVGQWVKTAKQAGMTFVLLTAKHEAGFCLWDSKGYDYDVANSSVKTDVIQQFMKACKSEGIKPCLHYSIADAHNDDGSPKSKAPVPRKYFDLIRVHTRELHRRYPGIFMFKFDMAQRLSAIQQQQLYDIIKKSNPGCIVMFGTGASDRKLSSLYSPKIVEATVNRGWFWSSNQRLTRLNTLYEKYTEAEKQGANFLLNIGVDTTGVVPQEYVQILTKLNKKINSTLTSKPLTQASKDPAKRLKKLKELLDAGLITEEEFIQKRKDILSDL